MREAFVIRHRDAGAWTLPEFAGFIHTAQILTPYCYTINHYVHRGNETNDLGGHYFTPYDLVVHVLTN